MGVDFEEHRTKLMFELKAHITVSLRYSGGDGLRHDTIVKKW